MTRRSLLLPVLLVLGCEAQHPVRHDPNLKPNLATAIPLPSLPPGASEIGFAGGKKLYVSWVAPADEDGGARFEFASFDGTKWGETRLVARNVDVSALNGREPSLLERPDGSVIARWFAKINTAQTPAAVIARSTDDGESWHGKIALDRKVGEGDGPFAWIDTGHDVPYSATILPYATASGEKWQSVMLARPDDNGVIPERTLIDRPVSVESGVSAARCADSMLIGFRHVEWRGAQPGETDVSLANFRINGGVLQQGGVGRHDGWHIPSEAHGIGPVVASHEEFAGLIWYSEVGGPTLSAMFSRDHGRLFQWRTRLDVEKGVRDLRLAVAANGAALAGWTNASSVMAQRFDVANDTYGPMIPVVSNSKAPTLVWIGYVGDAPWIAWSDGALHLSRVQ